MTNALKKKEKMFYFVGLSVFAYTKGEG